MPATRSSLKRFLPHVAVTTFGVVVLPALAVSFIDTAGRAWLVLASVLLAMVLSLVAASLGCAIWTRRPGSRDIVFGDLLLWGWLRRTRAERRLAKAQGLLESGAVGRDRRCRVLQRLAALMEAKDARTLGHTRRVTRHAERIAREMGLSGSDVARIRTAASVHDVGKVHTPRRILVKPGRLTDQEFTVIKRHPVDGADMVAEIGDPELTAMVRHHHERLDGSGYPDGLSGREIPLGARIISVADTFDAMTSSRPYHEACKHQRALDVLSEEAGMRLDPDAVAAFLRYYSGKSGAAWSAFGVTGSSRLVGSVSGLLNGVGGWTAPLAQGIAGIAAVALVGASLGGQAAPATQASEAAPQTADRVPGPDRKANDRSERRAARRAQAAPRGGQRPVSHRTPNRSRRRALGGGSAPLGSSAPDVGTPTGSSPSVAPSVDVRPGDLPSAELPNVELPNVELPNAELPPIQVPGIDVPEVQLPQVQLSSVEVSGIELPQVQLPTTALPHAH